MHVWYYYMGTYSFASRNHHTLSTRSELDTMAVSDLSTTQYTLHSRGNRFGLGEKERKRGTGDTRRKVTEGARRDQRN